MHVSFNLSLTITHNSSKSPISIESCSRLKSASKINRKSVIIDEKHHVNRVGGVGLRVVDLASDGKDVGRKALGDERVEIVVGRAVEQGKVGLSKIGPILKVAPI